MHNKTTVKAFCHTLEWSTTNTNNIQMQLHFICHRCSTTLQPINSPSLVPSPFPPKLPFLRPSVQDDHFLNLTRMSNLADE